jgi:hypothetical protein
MNRGCSIEPIPADVQAILSRVFDDKDICSDAPRHGSNFRPTYVRWEKVLSRLNEATGGNWDWVIDDVDISRDTGTAIVRGHVTIHLPGGKRVTRGGVGAVVLEINPNGYFISVADDVKAAETDAFKRACVKLGIALHLYEKDREVQQIHDQAREMSGQQPAQPFQIARVRNMLAQNNLNEADLCRSLNIRQLEDMTASQVANALSSGPSTYLNTSHA